MAYNYNAFYKIGNDIFRSNGQKLSYEEALPMFKSGFNAAFIPERQAQPQVGQNIPGTNLQYEAADIANLENNQSQPTYQAPVQQARTMPSISESGQYYKSGNDVYESGTNRHIDLDEFQRLGLNFALLPQGQAPVQQESTGNLVVDNIINQLNSSGDENSRAMSELIKENQKILNDLIASGKTVNPNVEITPELTAKWLTQAQGEISPYYSNQMKLAREGLLRQAGYTSDEILANEREVEKKYGQNLRTLSENAADTGMALSGRRLEGEQNLAQDTQSSLDQARKAAEYNAGSAARQYASEWGGANTPQFNYSQAPRVLAGKGTFERSLGSTPFYSISDSVLSGLTGSKEFEEKTATKMRQSELESLYRQEEANKQRSLTL
jgi:hypothetical protein